MGLHVRAIRKRFARGANAHLSDDKAVAKMGHSGLWLKGSSGCGGMELVGVLRLRSLHNAQAASLRWDEERRTFLVRARGTDIPSGGRYAMKTHIRSRSSPAILLFNGGGCKRQECCKQQVVNEGGHCGRGCGRCRGPAGGGGGERFLAGVCAGGAAGGGADW